ncbi:retinal pigment epithelial membrane family protein [Histoplasma capsulatum var. duboisii H88]|uniref:Retinal pigment epithelial membrane family protein n=1 Tax=Ajellomyces capsulatus (strain H88) TaxID=544711 RepID=A0A8A1LS96_AJEC8|nr:retinal pigment epithelial membrane family protein [Histoplasma capsulatum var. duboisii H88]
MSTISTSNLANVQSTTSSTSQPQRAKPPSSQPSPMPAPHTYILSSSRNTMSSSVYGTLSTLRVAWQFFGTRTLSMQWPTMTRLRKPPGMSLTAAPPIREARGSLLPTKATHSSASIRSTRTKNPRLMTVGASISSRI